MIRAVSSTAGCSSQPCPRRCHPSRAFRAPSDERQATGPEDPVALVAGVTTESTGELLRTEHGSPVLVQHEASLADVHGTIPLPLFVALLLCRRVSRGRRGFQGRERSKGGEAWAAPETSRCAAPCPTVPLLVWKYHTRHAPGSRRGAGSYCVPPLTLNGRPCQKGDAGFPEPPNRHGTPGPWARPAGYHLSWSTGFHLVVGTGARGLSGVLTPAAPPGTTRWPAPPRRGWASRAGRREGGASRSP